MSEDRKQYPMYSGFLAYFPKAVKYVSHVSLKCNEQHHKGKPLHWDKSKSTDELDALMRHLADHSESEYDVDRLLHLGKVAWRAMAMLERLLISMDVETIETTNEPITEPNVDPDPWIEFESGADYSFMRGASIEIRDYHGGVYECFSVNGVVLNQSGGYIACVEFDYQNDGPDSWLANHYRLLEA